MSPVKTLSFTILNTVRITDAAIVVITVLAFVTVNRLTNSIQINCGTYLNISYCRHIYDYLLIRKISTAMDFKMFTFHCNFKLIMWNGSINTTRVILVLE